MIPHICYKDQLLLTATIQYFDYLKGLFNLNNDNMENQIRVALDEELNLPRNLEEKHNALCDAIDRYQVVFNKLINYRDSVLNEDLDKEIKGFLHSKEIKEIAADLTYVDVNRGGYRFACEGKVIDLIIGRADRRWFVQMQWADETPYNDRNFPKILCDDKGIYDACSQNVLNEYPSYKWIYRYCPSLEETSMVYKNVLKRIVEIINE